MLAVVFNIACLEVPALLTAHTDLIVCLYVSCFVNIINLVIY